MSITPTNPSGVAGESTITLTCSITLSGSGTPTIYWSGPMTRGPITPEEVQTSFTDSFVLVAVRESYAGQYTCHKAVASTAAGPALAAPNSSLAKIDHTHPRMIRSCICCSFLLKF